ncbi:uncharacterized protein BXIN_2452 [Babesia sp. Xinjiang]|uniref:uncharacterized protein n=1 Tax=Babesia sp. Xinjiang TaxID=462227 RepID=UPI000A249D76|nr:uncharacterized protein BXIN_2452 [Babesia sp. Xinjiang]ORM41430.1 hypothetical protein BXIN_2452 [Babesia sp. Xinjiang]
MKSVDLEAKYGKKRAKKMLKMEELKQHGKVEWNPRDRVGDTNIKELDADDIDIKFRPRIEKLHFLNKSIYDMTEDEFYGSFFRDRERQYDGKEKKLHQLETQILKEQQAALSAAPRTRIAPRHYWVDAISPNVCVRTLLRFLQIVSKVQLSPTQHVRRLVDHIHRRRAEMKPKHYVFLFQALGRLRLRDQRLYDDLYEMLLCWSVLRNNFLIKAANALAKLGVCDSLLLQPLRQVLAKRIDVFSATDCLRIKAITVLDLFDDVMVIDFLSRCEFYKQHFRHYSRNLELIELYIRLQKSDLYDKLDDTIKQFLIDTREQSLSKKLAENDTSDTGCYRVNEDDNVPKSHVFHCSYHEDVSRILTLMNVDHRNYVIAGPFILDVYEPKSNTVIEINSEYQYYHGTTHLTATARRLMFLIKRFAALYVPSRSLQTSACLLAPKQKGKKDAGSSQRVTAAAPDTAADEHLFNIYAGIPEDHTILPDEAYPKWLWDLDKPDKTYGELMKMFVYGHDIETARMCDYKRFRRLHNRALIKLNNLRLQKQRKFQIKGYLWDN